MNKIFFSALAAAALLPFAAQSQDAKVEHRNLTRADVLAELQRARASGEYDRIHAETQSPFHDLPSSYASPRAMRADKADKTGKIDKAEPTSRP